MEFYTTKQLVLFCISPVCERCFIEDQKLFPKSIKIEIVPSCFGVQKEKYTLLQKSWVLPPILLEIVVAEALNIKKSGKFCQL